MLREIHVSLRTIAKKPGLFLTATLILGAGIGVNTALFSLLEAVLLRPIPGVVNSGELIRIHRTSKGQVQGNQSYPDYVDLRDGAHTLQGLAAGRLITMRLAGPPIEIVPSAIVTGNYFQVLGVRPLLGRLLEPEDDRGMGAHPVAVLSEAFWQRRFAGDRAILGKTAVLNGRPFTVVGVAAGAFEGVEFTGTTALWIPMSMVREAMTRQPDYHWLTERRAGWLTYYGRLRRGVSAEAAQAELIGIGQRLEKLYPASNTGRSFRVTTHAAMTPAQRERMATLFRLLSAAATLVLLIACGNIGNLLLARAAAQTREMAVRMALGATRKDLLREQMIGASLVGLAGGALGVAAAPWMLPLLKLLFSTPINASVLDLRVLGFNLAITLVTVFLFGLAPAWFTLRSDLTSAGLTREFAASGRAPGRMMRAWVVTQVALSLALVVNGSLVLGSMRNILSIDPGYRTDQVAVTAMDLSLAAYTPERGTQFFLDLQEKVSRMPGVQSVTLAKSSPAVDWSDRTEVRAEKGGAPLLTDRNIIAPGYFRTLGIPLTAGRDFDLNDRGTARPVAIVSQSLAERLWPGQNALGRRVFVPEQAEVVGVVADARYRTVLDAARPLLYSPLTQNYDSIARLMVAMNPMPPDFKITLRRAVQEANRDLPANEVTTLREQIEHSVWERHAVASLLSFFGVLAIGLACAGVYGVVSYATAQQTREIAIRMALGASGPAVLAQVLGRTVKLGAIGVAIGVPIAVWVKPSLATMLYGVGEAEPVMFAAVSAAFLVVAAAAAALPARRAATIDPASALR